jgi:hypothetical protein
MERTIRERKKGNGEDNKRKGNFEERRRKENKDNVERGTEKGK